MKPANTRSMARLAMAGVWILSAASSLSAEAGDAAKTPPPSAGAAPVGGALPGGAIISAKFVRLTPAAGGDSITETIGSDGTFRFAGLKAGAYQMSVVSDAAATRMSTNVSVPKQTQGATFGEKVNAGLQQAGSAVASGAAVSQQTAPASTGPAAAPAVGATSARTVDSMPARISTNFTVGKQTGRLFVDGPGTTVEVGAGGTLEGRLSPVQ